MSKDYCGPYWMPKPFRRFLSSKFNASCKIHDMDYDSQRFTRHESDMRFLTHMIKQCRESLLWECVAWCFYVAVRIGGKISWRKSEQ